MHTEIPRRPYFFAMTTLLFLFTIRVLGQLSVLLFHPSFLPPMQEWYSGLLPYPVLLLCQILIILLFGKICLDFAGLGRGRFTRANWRMARRLSAWGTLYLAVMILRYACMQYLHPQGLWFAGCIPIFFHYVLAAFILVLAAYQHKASKEAVSIQQVQPLSMQAANSVMSNQSNQIIQ